jgi:tRNA pseudouridine38-40 synthase
MCSCPQTPLFGLQIRVLGFTRVTNGFDARKHCDRRRYEYILPVSAFCAPARPARARAAPAAARASLAAVPAEAATVSRVPPPPPLPCRGGSLDMSARAIEGDGSSQSQHESTAGHERQGDGNSLPAAQPPAASPRHDGEQDGEQGEAGLQDRSEKAPPATDANYSFGQEQLERLNGILKNFEGTHNFHNFTVRVLPSDPAATRYILSFKCEGTMELQVQQTLMMECFVSKFSRVQHYAHHWFAKH